MRADSFHEPLVAAVDRHHRKILVAASLLLVVSALSLLRLRLDMDVLSQLPSRSQTFRDYRRFLETFGGGDSFVVLIRGEQPAMLRFADALAARLSRVEEIGSVRYRVDLAQVRALFLEPFRYELLDEDGFVELERRLRPEAIRERVHGLKRALAMPMSLGARRWLLADPLGVDELVARAIERDYADPLFRPSSEYFLSPEGGALLMVVRPLRSAFDTIFAERLLSAVAAIEQELLAGPFRGAGITVAHTGSYVYALADKRVLQSDFGLYFLLAPLAVLLIFHLGLRSLRILPFVIFPLLLTTAVTFALSALCFEGLNMISVAFAGIFYGLGIDSSIYFYGLLREQAAGVAARDRDGLRRAVGETLREIGAANVVASGTTAVAFVVIGLSDFTGVSQLGLMTALAMALNVVATFVVLPALVFAWGPRAVPERLSSEPFAEACARWSSVLAARRGATLALSAALLVAAGWMIPRVRLDTDFRHLRPGDGEAERAEQEIHARFGRVDARGVVVVDGDDVDSCLRAAERVAAALERARAAGQVRAYSALASFFPSAETAARRLARFRALPRDRAAEALRRALADEGFDPEAFAGFVNDLLRDDRPRITVEGQSAGPLAGLLEQHLRRTPQGFALATYFIPAPGVTLGAVRARLHEDLAGEPLTVTGSELAESEFARLLRRELVWFIALALVSNFAFVIVAERRAKPTLALLAPTLAALVLYLGAIGLCEVAIDPVNLIVLPLLIGLGVDDSVYLAAHVRHGGLGAGVRRGIKPLLLATATTVAGFGTLALSRFPALARLGALAGLALTLCALLTFVLVPVLGPWLAPTARDGDAGSGDER
jgi:predicted RND superfamily exporter protein